LRADFSSSSGFVDCRQSRHSLSLWRKTRWRDFPDVPTVEKDNLLSRHACLSPRAICGAQMRAAPTCAPKAGFYGGLRTATAEITEDET
jgi:hypothetical protein